MDATKSRDRAVRTSVLLGDGLLGRPDDDYGDLLSGFLGLNDPEDPLDARETHDKSVTGRRAGGQSRMVFRARARGA